MKDHAIELLVSSEMALPTALIVPVGVWCSLQPHGHHATGSTKRPVFWVRQKHGWGHDSLHWNCYGWPWLWRLSSWWWKGIVDNPEWVVLLMVHTYHKYKGISRRDRDDDSVSSTFQVSSGLLHGCDPIAHSLPGSLPLMMAGSHFWKIEMDFWLMMFPVFSLDCHGACFRCNSIGTFRPCSWG